MCKCTHTHICGSLPTSLPRSRARSLSLPLLLFLNYISEKWQSISLYIYICVYIYIYIYVCIYIYIYRYRYRYRYTHTYIDTQECANLCIACSSSVVSRSPYFWRQELPESCGREERNQDLGAVVHLICRWCCAQTACSGKRVYEPPQNLEPWIGPLAECLGRYLKYSSGSHHRLAMPRWPTAHRTRTLRTEDIIRIVAVLHHS